MRRWHKTHMPLLPALVVVGGCATVSPRLDYERAAEHIRETTGQADVYRPGQDDVLAKRTEELLGDGLTVDEAVQVCLLNNPELQAAFFSVGMARADVVQSGLLSNPSLGVSLRLPAGGGLANLEAGLAQNIADLWQIPLRKRAAQRALDQAILELSQRAAELAADAKTAYYAAAGAQELHQITMGNLAIAEELLALAITRQKAGAGTELDVNLSRGLVLDAELAVESARLAMADARRTLARLLGVTSEADKLVLQDPLPKAPAEHPDPEILIEVAWRHRLDIRAACQAVFAAEARLQEQYRLVFPFVEIGVELERGERKKQGGRDLLADTARASISGGRLTAPEIQPRSERHVNTDLIIGPALSLELPIFDQNQAQIAKAGLAYRQAAKTLEALDRAVTQEIRGAADRATTAWRLVQLYRDRSLPLAKTNLDLSRESYRVGKASFLAVLEAQRFFLESRRRYVEALQTAASTIPELERTVGLPFRELLKEAGVEPTADDATTQPSDGAQP